MHLCFSIGSIGPLQRGAGFLLIMLFVESVKKIESLEIGASRQAVQVFSYSCSLLNLSKRENRSRGEQADRPCRFSPIHALC